MTRNRAYWWIAFFCGAQLAAPVGLGQGQLRKARVGDRMEAFSLSDLDGTTFSPQQSKGRVLVIAFLAAHHTRSERAIAELKQIVFGLRHGGHPMDLVAIVSSGEDLKYFRGLKSEAGPHVPVLVDQDDQLWGKLGITATPTVLAVDKEGMITWIRAGHGYDFGEEARSELAQALGLEPRKNAEPHGQVEVLANDASEDRARRHLRMGHLLDDEGRTEAAIAELRKAEALAPKSVEVQLELGRLLCRAGRSGEAVSLAAKIATTAPAQDAEVKMLSGWAHRQLGDRDLAEKLLSESVRLNPQSVRALYELGKVYHERGDKEKAMEIYEHALAAHFQEAPFSSGITSSGPARHKSHKGGESRPR